MAIKTTKGTVSTFRELIEAITAWVTDSTIHGADAWELMRDDPWPYGTIYKAKGRENGDHQYVGLMQNKYKVGETYPNWFFTEKNITSYFLWRNDICDVLTSLETQALRRERSFPVINLGSRTITFPVSSGYTPTFSFSLPVEIFQNDAQALHFGVFKQFSGAPFADLGGAMDLSNVHLMPYYVYYTVGSSTSAYPFQLPIYPGCGYPALTLDYDGAINGYFDYWLIKSASFLIVVTNNGDVWEAAFAGQFEPYDAMKEYAFPAVAIGGTSGLRQILKKIYLPPRYNTPTTVTGMMFDFRPHAWELSRSIPPFAALPEDSVNTPSPVMAMLPDGVWQGFANYVQGYDHVVRDLSSTAFFVRPGEKEISEFYRNIYDTKDEHILEPLELLQGQGDKKGLLGKIPEMFLPSKPIHEYGEITADGVKYLSIPNGWEDRLITSQPTVIGSLPTMYQNYTRYVQWDEQDEINYFDQMLSEERLIKKRSRIMNLMIRMED